MTTLSTDWLRAIHVATWQTAANRPDADADVWKMALFTSAFDATTYDPDTSTGFGVLPFTTANAEVTGTGYTAGGPTISGFTTLTAGGAHCWRGDDVVLGPGVTLAASFTQGLVYDSTPTTKWGLIVVDLGGSWTVTNPAIATIAWPDTPTSGTILSAA